MADAPTTSKQNDPALNKNGQNDPSPTANGSNNPPPAKLSQNVGVHAATVNKFTREIDAIEELMRQKFRAKCRFRALGRMVINNLFWLSEAVEVYEGDNVKMRVEQAMRSAAKSKSEKLLNLNDKALLNKPAHDRTDQEKKYLYRLIGGLKCFKRYPKIVKKKLAAVTYFKYYGPGRVIVKQHHEAHALYFIMSGEVIVSISIFDELMQKTVSIDVGQMGVGTMFGEVSLLHNIPRTATCTASGHCEFLQLMKEDFKTVLQHSVQKQWDTIKLAMSAFSYFNGLDDVSRRECCIVSKMKSFKPKDTIYGDNVGVPNFVYFVLSGRAQMIESLDILVSERCGRKQYKLVYDEEPEEDSHTKLEDKYFLKSKSTTEPPKQDRNQSKSSKTGSVNTHKSSQPSTVARLSERRVSICPTTPGSPDKTDSKEGEPVPQTESGEAKDNDSGQKESSKHNSLETDRESNRRRESQRTEKDILPCYLFKPKDEHRPSIRLSLNAPTENLVKTYFMQVCEFLPGATFGFGENMRDRRIVALTQVDVLMMPIVWLLQRNINNIWTRIRHYIDRKIPTKKQLFKEFVAQRNWNEYKEKCVNEVIKNSKRINFTTIHDVPYSIRMDECLDI